MYTREELACSTGYEALTWIVFLVRGIMWSMDNDKAKIMSKTLLIFATKRNIQGLKN
jgi:hypothetical protein